MALAASLATSLAATSDLESGYIRSLLPDRQGRAAYLAEKLALGSILAAGCLFAAVASHEAFLLLAGFSYRSPDPVGRLAGWLALAWLHVSVYAAAAALVAVASRSRAAGVLFACLVGSGLVGALASSLLLATGEAIPALGALASWLPYGEGQLLGQGASALFRSAASAAAGAPGLSGILVASIERSGVTPWAHVLLTEVAALSAVAAGAAAASREGDV